MSHTTLPGRRGGRKPARLGLEIQYETRAGDTSMARLIESTVWVNDAHPAFQRALASNSQGYHIALAVAMALAPLAAESKAHDFVNAFMASWGEAAVQKVARSAAKRGS